MVAMKKFDFRKNLATCFCMPNNYKLVTSLDHFGSNSFWATVILRNMTFSRQPAAAAIGRARTRSSPATPQISAPCCGRVEDTARLALALSGGGEAYSDSRHYHRMARASSLSLDTVPRNRRRGRWRNRVRRCHVVRRGNLAIRLLRRPLRLAGF